MWHLLQKDYKIRVAATINVDVINWWQVNKFTAKYWAEQSVCTSLNENGVTHSVLLGLKMLEKEVSC